MRTIYNKMFFAILFLPFLGSTVYDPDDRAVLAYTDESTKNIQISDTTFDALAQFYSKEQVVEIATLCAGYNMVSRFIEATQVEPESRAKVAELPALPIDEVGM